MGKEIKEKSRGVGKEMKEKFGRRNPGEKMSASFKARWFDVPTVLLKKNLRNHLAKHIRLSIFSLKYITLNSETSL